MTDGLRKIALAFLGKYCESSKLTTTVKANHSKTYRTVVIMLLAREGKSVTSKWLVLTV
jgi:hypothetical protein